MMSANILDHLFTPALRSMVTKQVTFDERDSTTEKTQVTLITGDVFSIEIIKVGDYRGGQRD